jgi:hypothetical protein
MSKKYQEKYEEAASRISDGVDVNKLDLVTGDNHVRIVEADFEEVYLHFFKDTDGNISRVVCPAGINRKGAADECPMCAEFDKDGDDDLRAKRHLLYNAIRGKVVKKKFKDGTVKKVVRFDPQVLLLDIGPMIFKQISAIQTDDEYPDIDEISLKIIRTGKGKKGTKYQVLPGAKKTALPEDLSELLDLAALAKPTPISEINEIMGLETEEDQEKPEEKGGDEGIDEELEELGEEELEEEEE